MTTPIGAHIGQLPPPTADGAAMGGDRAAATPFAERLEAVVREVDAAQRTSEQMAEDLAAGRHNDIQGTMLAMQEADIRLRFVANVRTRLIEAYREIMRMGA